MRSRRGPGERNSWLFSGVDSAFSGDEGRPGATVVVAYEVMSERKRERERKRGDEDDDEVKR